MEQNEDFLLEQLRRYGQTNFGDLFIGFHQKKMVARKEKDCAMLPSTLTAEDSANPSRGCSATCPTRLPGACCPVPIPPAPVPPASQSAYLAFIPSLPCA